MTSSPMAERKPKLLITGAGGLLGHALCAAARRDWSVLGVFRQRRPVQADIEWFQADLTDLKELTALLRRLRPRAVIHAAAAAQVADCQAHPDATEAINVAVPARLAELCAASGVDLTFTSTDLVFDGRHAPYDENSLPAPFCVYSDQKMRAEAEVLRRHPQPLVARLPLLFGLAPNSQAHFGVQMMAAIAQNKPIALFVDEYRTPVDTDSAAVGLLALLGRARGVLHLGGRTRLSRFALGEMMATAMGIAPTMLQPVALDAAKAPYRRAPDCSLDSRRAYGLGYDPVDLTVAIPRMAERFLASRWSVPGDRAASGYGD
jgi:dTDP-4-dehydrorhamnose reductase